jgi:competence protein ComFC
LNLFREILKSGLDFALPQMCLLCNREIEKEMVCNNCLDYLPVVNPPTCRFCGRPRRKGTVCGLCKNDSMLDHGRAWMLFIPPSDKLIHHFKYRRKTRLAHLLGRAMAGLVLSDHILATADAITPVPLHWWKQLRRGYDQASLLARIMSQETGISQQRTLKRIKNTRTQTRLDAEQRQQNVRNAFVVDRNGVADKKVILVDDVLTTGATMNECARALKENGAREVYACVAAITPG